MNIRHADARSILSPTSGFIAQAGFTHSLTPARNCTFACTYCYVPTMRIQAGLKPEDWQRWGQFTTFKSNAADLLLPRPAHRIYCSPLVDPYQPAEAESPHMPAILERLIATPPSVFVIQTRGALILRDLPLLHRLAQRTTLRVSFSITTGDDRVRRLYEPLCDPIDTRFAAVASLQASGIDTWITLAPLLPCDPETLIAKAVAASHRDFIGDPFHTRQNKPSGATTRDAAFRISQHHGFDRWHDPAYQLEIAARLESAAHAAGRRFAVGPSAFAWLANPVTL